MNLAALICLSILTLLTGLPLVFTWIALRKSSSQTKVAFDSANISVFQPILGGDPQLQSNLSANVLAYPEVEFLWLVDENDSLGKSAAANALAANRSRAQIIICPEAPHNQNPKVFKLAFALSQSLSTLVVLDDDCILQRNSLEILTQSLEHAALATGIPFYVDEGNIWTRLLAQFPNTHSLVTYFSQLPFAAPTTINGMFYATHRSTIEKIGGFHAISEFLCDDFELAKIYRKNGLSIQQSLAAVSIRTTLPSYGSYIETMRRWIFFSRRQLSELISIPIVFMVCLPPLLVPIGLVLSLVYGLPFLFSLSALYFLKVLMTEKLKFRYFNKRQPQALGLKIVSDLLLPLHFLGSFGQKKLVWRSKKFCPNKEDVAWIH